MYEQSSELEALAGEVISGHENLAELEDCRIAYLYSDKKKKSQGKTVFADTELVKEKYRALLPYDFIITFYQPNCEKLNTEAMSRLMYHELRHVGIKSDGRFYVRPHDLEDFRDVVQAWGVDWIEGRSGNGYSGRA